MSTERMSPREPRRRSPRSCSSLGSSSSRPRSSQKRTSAPAISWASRNGTPLAHQLSRRRRSRARSPAAPARPSARCRIRRVATMPVNAGSSTSRVRDGVEDRLLVLLEVAVVAEREPLERREQAGEVADQPTGLAARELRDVGVLLLRHDRRPGRERVVRAARSRTPGCSRG